MPTPSSLEPDSQIPPLAPPTVEEGMEPKPAATQDSLLAKRAKELGAVYMLPGPADDHLLTPDEIEPRTAEPVIYEGFNYSQASRRYLREINPDAPSVAVEHGPGELRLRKFYRDERQAQMAFNFEILLVHDKGLHRQGAFARFEDYVAAELGEKMSRSTIYRRIVHAKWGLILAASGYIESLPSQDACAVMSELPRSHWIPMLHYAKHRCGARKLSAQRLKVLVAEYAVSWRLPLRGQKLELPAPPLEPMERNAPEPAAADPLPELIPAGTCKAHDKILLERLADELTTILTPRQCRKLQNTTDSPAHQCLAKLYSLSSKSDATDKVMRSKRLLSIVEETQPELAAKIRDAMLVLVIEQIELISHQNPPSCPGSGT